jgi:hypothetical protein
VKTNLGRNQGNIILRFISWSCKSQIWIYYIYSTYFEIVYYSTHLMILILYFGSLNCDPMMHWAPGRCLHNFTSQYLSNMLLGPVR